MIKFIVFDSETTGLHIVKDKAFMFVYGLVDEKLNLVSKHIVDTTDDIGMRTFEMYLKSIPNLVGHNIKFDIHMLINYGMDPIMFENKNFIDTAVLARLVINHDIQSDASFRTALKDLAVKYLGIDSANEERQLKAELSKLVMEHKQAMKEHFINKGLWDTTIPQRVQTRIINEIYNNWFKVYHLYPKFVSARTEFLENNPEPTYADVSNIRTYALTDIILTHGLLKQWLPKIIPLGQEDTLKRISAATLPLVHMERQGMVVDVNKILQDRDKLIDAMSQIKIIDPRNNEEYSVGQHAKLKNLFEYESGMLLTSSDKKARDEVEHLSPSARKVSELSAMNKYMTTYITNILSKLTETHSVKNNKLEYKVYTQYNLAGTITGRLSSDFQQFPRDPLVLDDGYEVSIRAWFTVPDDYKYMIYMDYAQMELRLQCEWTNIVQPAPDKNMLRAFEPYKTVMIDGEYYLEEDTTQLWKPSDLHSMTAQHAFPNVDPNGPDWKHYRDLGKRCNFACNYGASAPKIASALNVDLPTARKLVDGYKNTFAGVVAFSKWIGNKTYDTPYIPNLLFRKYYSRNRHQLQNWLVQGSGADILLLKLREVYDYIKDKPHWKFMISVHDEIGFVCEDLPQNQLQLEVKEIQKLLEYKMDVVDIIADVEYTTTSWAEKEDFIYG